MAHNEFVDTATSPIKPTDVYMSELDKNAKQRLAFGVSVGRTWELLAITKSVMLIIMKI
jgi:hypothetical protein